MRSISKVTCHLSLRRLAAPARLARAASGTALATSAVLAALGSASATASPPAAPAFALAALAPATAGMSSASTPAVAGRAAAPADFSGRWSFRPAKSANVGMMASLELHVAVEQNPAVLAMHEESTYQGQASQRDVRYDLGGKPVANRSPMGDPSETVSHWDGSRLVTLWTSQGAVAGTRVVRTETRSLSPDGKTMTLESVRAGAAPMIMVFERD